MAATDTLAPAGAGPLAHLKRAFGWNVGRVAPSGAERAALEAAGVRDPAAQRWAAWRRSVLLVALVPATIAFVLAVLDVVDDGFDEFKPLGVAFEVAWLVAAGAMPIACFVALRRWTRAGRTSRLVAVAWLVPFLMPFVIALLPAGLLYEVREPVALTEADLPAIPHAVREGAGEAAAEALTDVDRIQKIQALRDTALDLVLEGKAYLLLLPAVLSLLPGVMNGALRAKSLLPGAQAPGWILLFAAPLLLLFWTVVLLLVNTAARSALLEIGMLLWAGAPMVYVLRARDVVEPRLGDAEVARIARTKKIAGLVGLAGVAMLLAFVATKQVAGLHVVGLDPDRAMANRLEELSDSDDEMSLSDVQEAYAESTSLLYLLDLGSIRMVIDLLAKIFLATLVFADLVVRMTLWTWRNDRGLRARAESGLHDASAGALDGWLREGAPAGA
jgi:hypothetical protein